MKKDDPLWITLSLCVWTMSTWRPLCTSKEGTEHMMINETLSLETLDFTAFQMIAYVYK